MRRRPRVILLPLALPVVLATCRDQPTQPEPPFASARPLLTVVDAARGAGPPGFYFLSPIAPALATYPGTFDGSLSPEVEVCAWTGGACGPVVARHTRTTGTGAELVQVYPAEQHYRANWPTVGLPPGSTYRVRVLLGGAELGHADAKVPAPGEAAAAVQAAGYVPLGNATRLAIRFRIERGRFTVVGPAGGTVVGGVPDLVLDVPPGALAAPAAISLAPFAGNAQAVLDAKPFSSLRKRVVAAFTAGPSGLVFATPALARLALPAPLPAGAIPLVAVVRNGTYTLVPTRIAYDPATRSIAFTLDHFSEVLVFAAEGTIPNEHRCMARRIEVVTHSTDWSGGPGGACSLAADYVSVTFPDCMQVPQEQRTVTSLVAESTTACGPGAFSFRLTPSTLTLQRGQTGTVRATLTVRQTGEEIPAPVAWGLQPVGSGVVELQLHATFAQVKAKAAGQVDVVAFDANEDYRATSRVTVNGAGAVRGRVWLDDGDGRYTAGGPDQTLDGVAVDLLGPEPSTRTLTTAGGGEYRFDAVLPGAYTVRCSGCAAMAGVTWDATARAVTVADGVEVVGDFTARLPDAVVQGRVWLDDGDRAYTPGADSPVQGVALRLSGPAGAVASATRTSASDGRYRFENVRPGAYTLECTSCVAEFGPIWDQTNVPLAVLRGASWTANFVGDRGTIRFRERRAAVLVEWAANSWNATLPGWVRGQTTAGDRRHLWAPHGEFGSFTASHDLTGGQVGNAGSAAVSVAASQTSAITVGAAGHVSGGGSGRISTAGTSAPAFPGAALTWPRHWGWTQSSYWVDLEFTGAPRVLELSCNATLSLTPTSSPPWTASRIPFSGCAVARYGTEWITVWREETPLNAGGSVAFFDAIVLPPGRYAIEAKSNAMSTILQPLPFSAEGGWDLAFTLRPRTVVGGGATP